MDYLTAAIAGIQLVIIGLFQSAPRLLRIGLYGAVIVTMVVPYLDEPGKRSAEQQRIASIVAAKKAEDDKKRREKEEVERQTKAKTDAENKRTEELNRQLRQAGDLQSPELNALVGARPGLTEWTIYKLRHPFETGRIVLDATQCSEFEAETLGFGGTLEISLPSGNKNLRRMNKGIVGGPVTYDIKYLNLLGATFRLRLWQKVNDRCE